MAREPVSGPPSASHLLASWGSSSVYLSASRERPWSPGSGARAGLVCQPQSRGLAVPDGVAGRGLGAAASRPSGSRLDRLCVSPLCSLLRWAGWIQRNRDPVSLVPVLGQPPSSLACLYRWEATRQPARLGALTWGGDLPTLTTLAGQDGLPKLWQPASGWARSREKLRNFSSLITMEHCSVV